MSMPLLGTQKRAYTYTLTQTHTHVYHYRQTDKLRNDYLTHGWSITMASICGQSGIQTNFRLNKDKRQQQQKQQQRKLQQTHAYKRAKCL